MRPYEVRFGKDRFHLNNDMAKWCNEQFGHGGYLPFHTDTWMMSTMFGETVFAFSEEKHYTWFILRWQS